MTRTTEYVVVSSNSHGDGGEEERLAGTYVRTFRTTRDAVLRDWDLWHAWFARPGQLRLMTLRQAVRAGHVEEPRIYAHSVGP